MKSSKRFADIAKFTLVVIILVILFIIMDKIGDFRTASPALFWSVFGATLFILAIIAGLYVKKEFFDRDS